MVDKMQLALEHGANGLVAGTLEEIAGFAAAHGFNGGQLCRSISEYNECSRSAWEGLRPARTENFGALDARPFYALVVRPAITHTHGGLRIDASAHVLRPDDSPVGGLLAAGADAGGVYGMGYAGGLAMSLAFGIEAARTAGFGA